MLLKIYASFTTACYTYSMKKSKLLLLLLVALLSTSLVASVALPTQQTTAIVEILPEIQEEQNYAEPSEEITAVIQQRATFHELYHVNALYPTKAFYTQYTNKECFRPPIQNV